MLGAGQKSSLIYVHLSDYKIAGEKGKNVIQTTFLSTRPVFGLLLETLAPFFKSFLVCLSLRHEFSCDDYFIGHY